MSDNELQKRDDNLPVRRDTSAMARLLVWAAIAVGVIGLGALVLFAAPWLITLAFVLGGIYLAYRVFRWMYGSPDAEESTDRALPDPEREAEAELGSEIELEEMRKRIEAES